MTAPTPTASKQYSKHIPSIHYSDPPTRLQTLDIWLPRPLAASNPETSVWIVYLHGGAWRDPTQDQACIHPTLAHLLDSPSLPNIAAIASLNYRLSPYPSHPADPSTPSDADRNVQHPTHVRDVRRALRYLRKHYGLGGKEKEGWRWIGVGHSCGATLLLQVAAGIGLEGYEEEEEGEKGVYGLDALVLLEGIYDIPLLLQNHEPPACPPNVSEIYKEIVRGAFGADEGVYHAVSPVAGKFGKVWEGGRLVVLGHSPEDELVEVEQRDGMVKSLEDEGWSEGKGLKEGERIVEVRNLKGGHDEIWEDGRQIVELIEEVVQDLCK